MNPFCHLLFLLLCTSWVAAQDKGNDTPGLTIYNQRFAVVRETIPLQLTSPTTRVSYSEITAHAEPESVLLREVKSGSNLRVLEQNYRNDAASQALLLSRFEGQELDFLQPQPNGPAKLVRGKLIRSGYVPHPSAYSGYGQEYYQRQMAMSDGASMSQPIVEVEGKLQFSLPGEPIFPPFPKDTILKPTFDWLLSTPQGGGTRAELSYITGGMNWQADYNVVAPEKGDLMSIVGWVTLDNQSGRTFENARIKLMAGDVNKLDPQRRMEDYVVSRAAAGGQAAVPPVTERAFDEYHLYSLPRPTTLLDHETKQVEFLRAEKVPSQRIYVYDGVRISDQYRGYGFEYRRNQPDYGVLSNNKVWAMREFKNSKANGLGMPIPKGRLRFYRSDSDGQLEFTGESDIDHTPENETIRVYTGNAFDLAGERKRDTFDSNSNRNYVDESFTITVRNHKAEPTEVRIVEHLYRWNTWEITRKTEEFRKIDSNTVEFRVTIPPAGEKVVNYAVHYTW